MSNVIEFQEKKLRINSSKSRVEYFNEGSNDWMDDGPAPEGAEDLFVKNGVLYTKDDEGEVYKRSQYGGFSPVETKAKKRVEDDEDDEYERRRKKSKDSSFSFFKKKQKKEMSFDEPPKAKGESSMPLWLTIILSPFIVLWWIIKILGKIVAYIWKLL